MTVDLLGSYRQRLADALAHVDAELDDEAFLFSRDPAHEAWLRPSSVSQRYRRMCAGLGWDMDIKELRHYSATELIAAGVDVRTVAGRLGHGGGGTTTLRVYSAWRPEADRRAASTVSDRLPAPPLRPSALSGVAARPPAPSAKAPTEPTDPCRQIAADLRGAVLCGALKPGDQLPSANQLASRYKVASSTAHRAVAELAVSGLVAVSRGKRAIVTGQ